MPELLEQVQDHAGIERAGAGAHAETVERRESEAAVDAAAADHRAQAGAASKVRDDHAALCDLGRHPGQDRRDVFVRQAVKPVALDARAADLERQRNQIGDGLVPAMKTRVEAGDLRHAGQPRGDRIDGREVVRLMQGRERHELAQVVEHLRRDQDGRGIRGASVHDAVSDAEQASAARSGREARTPAFRAPPSRRAPRRRAARRRASAPGAVLGRESRRGPDALDLAARLQPPAVGVRAAVDAELQARRTGIENQDKADRQPWLRRLRRVRA